MPKLARIARALSLDVWFRMRDPRTGAYRFPYPPVDRADPLREADRGAAVEHREPK